MILVREEKENLTWKKDIIWKKCKPCCVEQVYKNTQECPVCTNDNFEAPFLRCKHNICVDCLVKMQTQERMFFCPLCKDPISLRIQLQVVDQIKITPQTDHIIRYMFDNHHQTMEDLYKAAELETTKGTITKNLSSNMIKQFSNANVTGISHFFQPAKK